ncbi:MAG TPA: hypothetical protein VF198_16085 [Vicinamibacterales bacterium]
MGMCRLFLVIALAVAAGTPAAAQPLAEIARREEARRAAIKKPSRVITNKDLRPVERWDPPSTAPAAAGQGEAAPAQPESAPGQPAAPAEQEQEEADPEAQEREWRQKMSDAKTALERSQMYHDALQSRINALWAEFTAKDDPAQRAVVELERRKAIAEQERVKEEIEQRKKAIADLEEEARRAGVPPGWLR